MGRRRLIVMLGGAAAAWPSTRFAQGAGRPRRIAVLMGVKGDDPESQGRFDALRAGLQERGWVDGETAKLEVYWAGGEIARIRALVTEIVAASPDIVVVNGTAAASSLHQATQTIPVIFVLVADPVGLDWHQQPRPAGRQHDRLYLLRSAAGREMVPAPEGGVAGYRLHLPDLQSGDGRLLLQVLGGLPGLGSQIKLAPVHGVAEVEGALAELAKSPGSSVIVGADPFNVVHRREIVALAERFRLPAVYIYRQLALDGGLMAYGPDTFDAFHRTADYVNRVLHGAKPADLPVQAPAKYDFVVNARTARKFGLAFSPSLLARADEVLE